MWPIICSGWIPNLTGNIFLLNPLKITVETGEFLSIDSFKDKIEPDKFSYISGFENNFVRLTNVSDKKKNNQDASPWLFVFLFNDKKMRFPSEILVFYSGATPYIYMGNVVLLEIEDKGLVKIEIKEFSDNFEFANDDDLEKQKKLLLKETFFAIRDLYHKHTHHVSDGNNDEVPDSLTLPSYNSDKNLAVKDIIQYYQEKIVEYNNYICDFIIKSQDQFKESQYLITSTSLLRQAKGCFIYGSNLLEMYKGAFTQQEYEYFKIMFTNATGAVHAFGDEINTRYNARISENSKKLALNSNLLAMLLIFLSILSLFSRALFGENSPQFIYIGLILLSVFGVVALISIHTQIHFFNE